MGTIMFGVAVAIHALRQADKTDVEPDEKIFDQVSGIGIVSGKTGQVFYNHAVNPAAGYIGQEPLEVLAVGVRTCFSVIHIYVRFRAFIELIQVGLVVLFQEPPLVYNAVAFIAATE